MSLLSTMILLHCYKCTIFPNQCLAKLLFSESGSGRDQELIKIGQGAETGSGKQDYTRLGGKAEGEIH